MKRTKRSYWVLCQKSVMAMWREIRPDFKVKRSTVTQSDMRFDAVLKPNPRCTFRLDIHGYQSSSEDWTLRLTAVLADERITALRGQLEGKPDQRNSGMVDFEVLATYNTLEGIDGYDLPELPLDEHDSFVRQELEAYCKRIDRIWESVGGCKPENVDALALWIIRHRHQTGASTASPAKIATAIVFREFTLALELLSELESEIIDHLEVDPTHEVRQRGYAVYKEIVDRGRALVAEKWLN
jgi:hypothetical protein